MKKLNIKHILSENKGFSIVESMIAISLLSVVVISFTFFSSARLSQIRGSYHSTCMQRSQDILDKIKSVGLVKSVNRLSATNNTMTRPMADPQEMLNFISNSQDWLSDNNQLMNMSGPDLIIRNHKALVGSMSMLNSLYNSDPAFCQNPLGVLFNNPGSADLVENVPTGHIRNVQTRIRIQTIDLNNGTLSCAPIPVSIRPAGLNINSAETIELLDNIKPEPGSVAHLGFHVTVTTSYSDDQNNNMSCNSMTTFNYPKISPNERDLVNNIVPSISSGPAGTCQSYTTANIVISAGANSDFKDSKAIVLLCRDGSGYTGPGAPPPCPGGPQRPPLPANINRNWVSCHQVTLCGNSPTNSATAEIPNGFNLNYKDISLGCNMAIDVMAVDPAHNISRQWRTAVRAAPAVLGGCTPCDSPDYTGPGYCTPASTNTSPWCVYNPPPPPDGDGDGGADGNDGGSTDGDDGGDYW